MLVQKLISCSVLPDETSLRSTATVRYRTYEGANAPVQLGHALDLLLPLVEDCEKACQIPR
jgi:hypothetical protein